MTMSEEDKLLSVYLSGVASGVATFAAGPRVRMPKVLAELLGTEVAEAFNAELSRDPAMRETTLAVIRKVMATTEPSPGYVGGTWTSKAPRGGSDS